jgi:hypothetical protein
MRTISTIFLIIFGFRNSCSEPQFGSVKSTEVKVQGLRSSNFIDIVLCGGKVWAISADSVLVSFDLDNLQASEIVFQDTIKITAIAKDPYDNIVIADTRNRIGKQAEGGKWNFTSSFKSRIRAIFFAGDNNEYFLTNEGIYSVKHGRNFFPQSSLNDQVRLPYAFRRYACTLMDSKDNIWLGYNHGEWGGDIYIFSTSQKRFIIPNLKSFEINLNPIFSFSESPGGVYFSGGLSHLYMTSGYIGIFQDYNFNAVFNNEYDNLGKNTSEKGGHYIGPISYNQWDNTLYFYSQYGFYKGDPKTDLSKVENWTNVVKPELLWTYGQSNATGYRMNVQKLICKGPGSFIFLTDQNGIGYFTGKELVQLR